MCKTSVVSSLISYSSFEMEMNLKYFERSWHASFQVIYSSMCHLHHAKEFKAGLEKFCLTFVILRQPAEKSLSVSSRFSLLQILMGKKRLTMLYQPVVTRQLRKKKTCQLFL